MTSEDYSRVDDWIARITEQVRVKRDIGGLWGYSVMLLTLIMAIPGLPGLVVGWLFNQLLPSPAARRICLGLLIVLAAAGWTWRRSDIGFVFLVVVQVLGILVGTQQSWKLTSRTS